MALRVVIEGLKLCKTGGVVTCQTGFTSVVGAELLGMKVLVAAGAKSTICILKFIDVTTIAQMTCSAFDVLVPSGKFKPS